MNTKTDGISSGLLAAAWLSTDCIVERYLCFSKPRDNDPCETLVRLSDAEAIINDLQNLVVAENQRKQQFEEEVDAKDAERWKWITRDGRTRELRIPANENKASIDAAIDGAIVRAKANVLEQSDAAPSA